MMNDLLASDKKTSREGILISKYASKNLSILFDGQEKERWNYTHVILHFLSKLSIFSKSRYFYGVGAFCNIIFSASEALLSIIYRRRSEFVSISDMIEQMSRKLQTVLAFARINAFYTPHTIWFLRKVPLGT